MSVVVEVELTDLVGGDVVDGDGADEARDGADAVGHAHEDTGVARSDVQMVHVKPWNRIILG